METQVIALVPSKERRVYVHQSGKDKGTFFPNPALALDWLKALAIREGGVVLGSVGGPGQELFIRVAEFGLPVYRIPIFRLQQLIPDLKPKASEQERAIALTQAWEKNPDMFYPLTPVDETIILLRELCRRRLNIQEVRKAATLQLDNSLRSLEWILPAETSKIVELLRKNLKELFREPELQEQIEQEFRKLTSEVKLADMQQARILAIRQFFSNPGFILGAKRDEQVLEEQIEKLLQQIPVWHAIKNGPVDIKGLGPAIGGLIIAEIGDIRRFPTPEALRSYARFHVPNGRFPQRKRGEVSPWNENLNRAVWFWTSDQMPRYEHPWRELYWWRKAYELRVHPEPIPREVKTRTGERTIHDFTLLHIDRRAKRWTGSQFLNFLWDLWQQIAKGNDPVMWYNSSSWPAYFGRISKELADSKDFLRDEIRKRRRKPEEKEEEEEREIDKR